VVEKNLDRLAFLVSQLSLVVDLQTTTVESQNTFDLFVQITVKEEFHIALERFHEEDVFDEDRREQSLDMLVVGHQQSRHQEVVGEELGVDRHERFFQTNGLARIVTLLFAKTLAALHGAGDAQVVEVGVRQLDDLPLHEQQYREKGIDGQVLHGVGEAVLEIVGQQTQQVTLVLVKTRTVHVAQAEQLVDPRRYLRQHEVSLVNLLLPRLLLLVLRGLHVLIAHHRDIPSQKLVIVLLRDKFLLIGVGTVLLVPVPQQLQVPLLGDKTHSLAPALQNLTERKQFQLHSREEFT
jgi:hypothetical protein